jgi:hypothetical protein
MIIINQNGSRANRAEAIILLSASVRHTNGTSLSENLYIA